MFVGLPSNYRKSVLADVAKQEEHSLEQVVCRNPRSKGQQVPPEQVLQFEIQINRISGVPMETVGRRDDVLSRGVRFAICKTNKPATPDQVIKHLHARPINTLSYAPYQYILSTHHVNTFYQYISPIRLIFLHTLSTPHLNTPLQPLPPPFQAGNPPEFLGNVTKLHALPRYNQPDLWDINDKDDLDPDRSCFVRCSTSTPYKLDYTR